MKQLRKVLTQTTWANASDAINKNSETLYGAIVALEGEAFKHKGFFPSIANLKEAYPVPQKGWQAYVYNTNNASLGLEPYDLYSAEINAENKTYEWQLTLSGVGNVEVDMEVIHQQIDAKQDKLKGYTEELTDNQVTKVGILSKSEAFMGTQTDEITNSVQTTQNSVGLYHRQGEHIDRIWLDVDDCIVITSYNKDTNQTGQIKVTPTGITMYGKVSIENTDLGSFISDATPIGITTSEHDEMKQEGTWESFVETHNLIYIYEE